MAYWTVVGVFDLPFFRAIEVINVRAVKLRNLLVLHDSLLANCTNLIPTSKLSRLFSYRRAGISFCPHWSTNFWKFTVYECTERSFLFQILKLDSLNLRCFDRSLNLLYTLLVTTHRIKTVFLFLHHDVEVRQFQLAKSASLTVIASSHTHPFELFQNGLPDSSTSFDFVNSDNFKPLLLNDV
jgi:hypothetical protein